MNQKVSDTLRTALCVLLLLAAYLLQSGLGLRLAVFGVHIDLLPLIVAAAGVLMGSGTGLVCGLAAGILYDVSGAGVEGIYPMYYMVWGIASGFAGSYYRGRETRAVMLCAVCMITALSLLRYLFYFQFVNDTGILIFARDMLARALLAVVLSPLALALVRRISGRRRHKPDRISTSPQA